MTTKRTAQKKSQKKTATIKKPRNTASSQQSVDTPPEADSVSFPIVGIGASAGGLEAFENLFTHMPPDSGMAFVIVQHLDPTHESILTDLLKKFTRMAVMQVKDKMQVEPNCIYVIPPNSDMELVNGALHLVKPAMPRGLRLPIDHFFRSLATDQSEKAICIILSGTGTDGTLGMKAIKEEGGLAIVQSPESARYDGMPMSAINTGLVDVILPSEKIAEQLVDYIKRYFETGTRQAQQFMPGISDHIQRIFLLLRDHTGHDFSGYKENTIARRIERRMVVNQITQIEAYLQYLQQTPLEIETLFRELLIGVTSFFRDREAFEHLEQKTIIPLFTKQRENPRQVRVWVPGCSTGEEAYSVAILLHEHMQRSRQPVEIQVFATDIDQAAITKARDGHYPDSIAADVSPERLKRFFTHEKDSNTYQVKRHIRDMVVFAVQSVIKDPPFSKLDLICCRNLMIYLGPELQQKLLSLFHYALSPGGYLFLGNSETLGNSQKLFHTIDQRWKIFERAEFVADIKTVLEFSGRAKQDTLRMMPPSEKRISARELTEQLLLTEYAPTSVLIDDKADMLYVHGHTGKFLEQSTGEASTNILRIAREGLRMPLSTAVRNATIQKKMQVIDGISIKDEDRTIRVKLTVAPVFKSNAAQELLLVTFIDIPALLPSGGEEKSESGEYTQAQHVTELEQELKSTREYLQTVIEELETTNEELKSSNEELQSSNEELQSTNEELQTSKEELQSVNEELVTVNTELQAKVDELTFANNDIKNLMESTKVGIIFLDTDLRIRRFTNASKKIVDLIPEDIGRPLKQFVHKLRHENLIKDAQEVLENQIPKEVEVQAEDNHWYLLSILPYRTVDEQIAGVVLTLANITHIKQAEQDLRQSEARYQAAIHHSSLIFAQVDRELRYTWIRNPHPDFDPQLVIGKRDDELSDNAGTLHLMKLKQDVLETGRGLRREIGFPLSNGVSTYDVIAEPLRDTADQVVGVATCSLDITERKQTEEKLIESEQKYSLLFQKSAVPLATLKLPEVTIVDVNEAMEKLVGYTRQEMYGRTAAELGIILPNVREQTVEKFEVEGALQDNEVRLHTKSGEERIVLINTNSLALSGEQYALTSMHDVTERKQAEENLRKSEEKFKAIASSTPDHILMQDLDLRYEFVVNPQIGLTEQDMLGKRDHDFMSKEDADNLTRIKQRVLESGLPVHLEVPVRSKDGQQGYFEGAFIPKFDSAKKITGLIGYFKDITEQKQAEEALRESEARYKSLFENNRAVMLLIDPESGLISNANHAACTYYGWNQEEILNKEIAEINILSPQEIQAEMQLAVTEQRTHFFFKHRLANGEIRDVEVYSGPIILDGKALLYSIVHDITERKEAERLLKESEEKYRLLFENMEEGFSLNEIITDENGKAVDFRTLDANPAYERHSGLKPDSIIGKRISEILPQADPRQIELYGTVALTGKSKVFEYYSVVLNRHLRVHSFCPRSGYFATIFENITEQKRAEEALRESETKFRAIFENSVDAIGVSKTGTHTFVNPAYLKLFGYAREDELIGKPILDLIAPDYREQVVQNVRLRAARQSAPIYYETRGLRKDGTEFEMDVHVSIYELNGGEFTLVHLRDITDRKQAEEALKQAYEEKQALLQELQHRVKNSFNLVVSMTRLMEDAAQHQEAKTTLTEIGSRVKAMAELYDLLYAKEDITETSLDEYCARIANSFHASENVSFKQTYEAIIISVKAATPVGLILTEFVTNALKHAYPDDESGVIEIQLSKTPAGARLEVKDDGVGISEEFNIAGSDSLGLTLVDALTKQINGSFRMERDNGTRCVLEFPIDD